MSARPARAAAFDGTCRAALLFLLALRLAEFALLDDAAFDLSSESLADLFFATTNSSLASFGLVPMALLLGSPVLSLASSAPVTVRLGRRGHVALCLRAVALRAVLFSAVVVGSGLLLVAARGYWVFDAGGALGFAAREALLMSLFFDACQVVMLLVWLAGSSLPTALCAGACYGVVDQLASFSRTLSDPLFHVGWFLTFPASDGSLVTFFLNAQRLLVIVILLSLACGWAMSRREALDRGGDHDVC